MSNHDFHHIEINDDPTGNARIICDVADVLGHRGLRMLSASNPDTPSGRHGYLVERAANESGVHVYYSTAEGDEARRFVRKILPVLQRKFGRQNVSRHNKGKLPGVLILAPKKK